MNIERKKPSSGNFTGDFFGGTAAMLVALPSAIAFGLIIFAPLGAEFSSQAAIGGIVGTIALGLVNPLLGGTKNLISAPCAPAAAVLSVFVAELVKGGSVPVNLIPVYVTVVGLCTGIIQVLLGKAGGGKIIKYIPYPVVAGYLSGVGVLIILGQLPKALGLPKGLKLWDGLMKLETLKWESICIALVTIIVMVIAPKIIKAIPAAIIALVAGILAYFGIAFFHSNMLSLDGNSLVIGTINASTTDLANTVTSRWTMATGLDSSAISILIVPILTLAALLSIDTLKTCVVLDALTYSRHNSNKELVGQGFGNIASAMLCGIPGSGTMGATLVNLNSGGKSKMAGVIAGATALLVLLVLGKLVAWIPIAALAGILILVGFRMVDKKSVNLLKHKSTFLDFFVILAVVISALTMDLIAAAGVGIGMAILLFLREQMRTSVIRRKVLGNQVFSKKHRLSSELAVLEEKGSHTVIIELQGQLFFGTTDQLFTQLEPYLAECRFALLDMRRVQSVDYTAVHMLEQILARIKEKHGFLIITSIPLSLPSGQNVKTYFEYLGLSESASLKFFDDLNSALEWVEDEILHEADMHLRDENKILNLEEIEMFTGFSPEAITTFLSCVETRSCKPNEFIFRKKDLSDEIYFIRKGTVNINLPLADGKVFHLLTVGKGGVLGDMAFIDQRKRSADAVAAIDSELFVLSRQKFNEVSKKHPEIAGIFFERLALLIANRLRQSDKELKALQES